MARPARSDRRYLELHGTKWRVVVAVPRPVQGALGATKLKHTLATDSLSEANRQKWAIVAQLQAKIEAARNPQGTAVDLQEEAKRLASLRRLARCEEHEDGLDEYISQRVEEIAGMPIGANSDGTARYQDDRERAAKTFAGIATGQRTPIDAHRERYQEQLRVKARTIADDNRAMKFLLDWCKSENIPPFLETFGRREAARFTDAFPELIGTKQPRTLNKYVQRLGAYWKWLVNRDEVQLNVWEGRSYTVPLATDAELERAFTDAEVLKLLNGDASPAMHDLMRVAALTGARIEVIVDLTAGDCQNGVFIFQPQKKETSRRVCPIHTDLKEIVERRTDGREEGDRVFPEWPSPKSATSQRKHSTRASNEFTAYRRRVGVDDTREGNRRSKVNFHSFRRWFITKAEQADQPVTLIAAVVGHKREGMTLGVYSAGPKLEQARRCVEAVELPKEIEAGE